MDTNIQDKKIELIQWLSTLDDISIIEKIMELREREQTDWWNDLSSAEKDSLKAGIDDANSGKLNPHTDARKIYEKWL